MEFTNKSEGNQEQQIIKGNYENREKSRTQQLKSYHSMEKQQSQQYHVKPSMWQLSIIILLVTAVLALGLYSYIRLNQKYQQYNDAINQKMDQLKTLFQLEKKKISNKLQNLTMQQFEQDIYFNKTFSKITQQHDQIYGSIKSILAISQQSSNYKQNNSKKYDSMKRDIEQIEEFKRQIQQYYNQTKTSPYLPLFNKIVSDGGPSTLKNQQSFEKVVWLFVDSIESDQSYANSLYYRNIKYFSEKSGFEVKLVTMNNYLYYLSPEKVSLLTNIFTMLKTIIRDQYGRTNLGDHFQNIAKMLILMNILEEHGGIIIKDYLILLESLDWIYNITEYQFVNKGNGNTSPKVIAFFDTEYSSIKRIQKKDETSDNQTPMYKFPSIEQNFIMAVKNSELITLINQQMIRILFNATTIKDEIEMQKYEMNKIKGQDPYYQFFFIASHIVLQNKQRELDQWVYLGAGDYPTKFSLDYYGLYTINRYYGPFKLKIFLENKDQSLMFKYLSKISIDQLEEKIGKIQFMSQIKFSKNLQYKMKQIKQKNTIEVMKDSFIEKMLFSSQDSQNIQFYENQKIFIDYPMQINKKWQQLPKIIWVYSSSFINDDLKVIQERCINRIKYLAEKSNFVVNVVTEDIANIYLSSEMIQKINQRLNKSMYPEHFRLKQIIIILAILSKYGGVYMESSYIALQSFDWIVNIPSMNPKYINNRLGEVPNVLLFTNPWFSQNFNWTINKQSKSRNKTDVVYDYDFIAAKKESRVIIEYLEQLLRFIKMQFQNIQQQLLKCGVQNPISKDNRPDLLPHDSFTCAMKKGIKLAQIQKLPFNGEYNVWSIDGETNIFKFNSANNYENVHKNQNLFLASYSEQYVKKIVGKFDKVIKLEGENLIYLNTKIKNYQSDNNGKIHNQSIISKYLLSQSQ